ncbi:hypothetical protein M433DRAFT_140650 [Acidomyces richmondensis BFW]|nr:MAG: hypothetical protein FE78DRAFT_320902 [Acidomyces sp. 'richmondensis']KYG48804.1 hypothetical protein M433DRAFT_140650 [Acidomyces richmondensis BFW]
MGKAINLFLVASLASMATALVESYFGVIAARSGSPINFLPMQARGLSLWIGGNSAHYCPIEEESVCPNTTMTNFLGGRGELTMGAIVPGGQQVYIDPTTGSVNYTEAHSAIVPDGAILDGWNRTEGEYFGYLSWKGGLQACNSTVGGPYGVYAVLPNVKAPGDCMKMELLTGNETKPDAWQYI